MKHGRYPEAYQTLVLLRGEPILAAKEILYVHYQMQVEMRHLGRKKDVDLEVAGVAQDNDDEKSDSHPRSRRGGRFARSANGLNYWQKLSQLFTKKRVRRATVASVVCMVGQQLCGVNVLAFYSSTFFCDSNGGDLASIQNSEGGIFKALFLSWGIGLCNVIFALP